MKYSLLFKNSIILTISGVFSRFISFLFIPIFTHHLEPSEYGVFDLYTSLISVGIFLFGLELSQGFSREFSEKDNKLGSAETHFATAFWGLSAISICLLFIALPLIYTFSGFLFGAHDWRIVLLFGLQIFFQGLFSLLIVKLHFEFAAKKVAILSIVVGLSNNLVSLVLALNDFGFISLMIGFCISNFVGFLVGYLWLKPNLNIRLVSKDSLLSMLRFSLPLVVYSISIYLCAYLDRLVIKSNLDLTNSGIYAIATRFASVIILFTSSFGAVLTPLLISHHQSIGTKIKAVKLFKTYLIFGFAACLFVAAIAKPLMQLMVAPQYYAASGILLFLCAALFINSLNAFLPGFFIAKKSSLATKVGLATALVSSALNYLLSRHYGLPGTAYAAITASVLGFIFLFQQSNQHFPILIQTKYLVGKFITFIIFLLALSQESNSLMAVLYVFIFLIISFYFKWVRIRDLKNIIKRGA